MNRQVFPSSLFPLRGDISAESGATSVIVTGIQGTPINPGYSLNAYDTILYNENAGVFVFGSPWQIPVGQVLEFEGYGYNPVGISWLASDTIAIGDGTQGDVSGAAAMTALILFGSSAYADYDLYHTTIYSGATQDWSLILPEGPGSSGQVLATNGHGFTYWANSGGGGGGGFTYTVTDQTSNYNANSGDDVWCIGTFNVTLPPAGVQVRVKINNRGTGVITVIPSTGTINGSATYTIASQYSSAEFATDGTNWGIE